VIHTFIDSIPKQLTAPCILARAAQPVPQSRPTHSVILALPAGCSGDNKSVSIPLRAQPWCVSCAAHAATRAGAAAAVALAAWLQWLQRILTLRPCTRTRPLLAPLSQSSESESEMCWICLEEAAEDGSHTLMSPCRCPRKVHPQCLARWQLQQAGRHEEKFCRYCCTFILVLMSVCLCVCLSVCQAVLCSLNVHSCCTTSFTTG
jgi:RING-variant domain